MKTFKTINFFLSCILCMFLFSCSTGPTDSEVLNLVKPNGFILKKEIQKKGASQTIQDTKVFSFTVSMKFIQPGMTYGYISECPEAQCCKDVEIDKITEYLIRKNQWKEWEIYESRVLNNNEIREIWRPASTSQEVFYKDYK